MLALRNTDSKAWRIPHDNDINGLVLCAPSTPNHTLSCAPHSQSRWKSQTTLLVATEKSNHTLNRAGKLCVHSNFSFSLFVGIINQAHKLSDCQHVIYKVQMQIFSQGDFSTTPISNQWVELVCLRRHVSLPLQPISKRFHVEISQFTLFQFIKYSSFFVVC